VILELTEHPDGVETDPGNRIVYDVAANAAHFGAARVDGRALVWDLVADPGADEWILRCDRVDFPPGGIAYRHRHPGPGLRFLLRGTIRIDTGGGSHSYGPGEWWYEPGPEPVYAVASETEETAFVRVMALPAEWAGKRTIAYVDPADDEKPKLQRATILLEHPIER
jgi:quercetin dioxygenase-like cupin family protein